MRRLGVTAGFAGLVLVLTAAVANADAGRGQRSTSRSFYLGAGMATRTFTIRESKGVILLNRLTVRDGVRVVVEAQLWAPALNGAGVVVAGTRIAAGARVTSWQVPNDPSLSCRHVGASQVCTQGEEWCPMPQATWHFRLTKQSGPAGQIRFDYLIGPPSSAA